MPPKKPSKLTPNKQAWNKEVKRLQREMKRAEKRGQPVPADFIPQTPTRITKKQLNLIRSTTLKEAKQKKPKAPAKPSKPKAEKTPKRTTPTTSTSEVSRPRMKQDPQISKEKERIRSVIYRAKKRGYETVKMADIMAAKPEGVDTLTYLQSLRGNQLYEFFRYKIAKDAQGKPIYQTGAERRKEENWSRAQLGIARRHAREDARQYEEYAEPGDDEIAIIDAREQYLAMLYQELLRYTPSSYWGSAFTAAKNEAKASIEEFINYIVERDGEYTVAMRLQRAMSSSEIRNHLNVVLYSSDKDDVEASYTAIATAVAGRPLTRAEAELLTVDN